MKKKPGITIFLTMIMLMGTVTALTAEPAEGLSPLKPLSGKWVGRGDGVNGPSVVKQMYHFVLNGAHFQSTITARFKPKEGEAVGTIRKAAGIFSFSPVEKVIYYREFSSDGQVHVYSLISVSKDKMTLTFRSNPEKGNRKEGQTRIAFQVIDGSHLRETVSRATDGKTFKEMERIVLRKVTRKKNNRIRKKLKNRPHSAVLN